MKKILTVSLVAIMAVGAAHAKIASTEWVEESQAVQNAVVSALDTRVGTAEQNISTLSTNKLDKSTYDDTLGAFDLTKGTVAEQIASKVAQSDYETKIEAIEKQLGDEGTTGAAIKELEDAVGTMSELTTDAKTLVGAINEVDEHADAALTKIGEVADGKDLATMIADEETARKTADGDLKQLTTDVQTSLVGAINEVDAHADDAQRDATSALTKIGTVADDTNLATMLSEETDAREQADTGLQNQIGTYDAEKQTWSGMKGDIANNAAAAAAAQTAAETAQETANAKFAKISTVKGAVVTTTESGEVAPVVPEHSEDGVYVLTATKNGDSVTYYWENIARKTPASEPETPNGEES